MSTPDIPDDLFARIEQAQNAQQARLAKSVAAFESAQLPYAIVGGHATAAWVASADEGGVRTTVNIDFLINRTDLAAACALLTGWGFHISEHAGHVVFIESQTDNPIHGIFLRIANEKFRDQDLEPAPAVEQHVILNGRRVIELEAHVRMLLIDNRTKAKMYINDMIDVGLLDQTWHLRFQPELTSRLQYLLDHHEPWDGQSQMESR